MFALLRHMSGWVPIAMSLTAIMMLYIFVFFAGIERETDEGFAAHMFQLLMAGQIPIIAYFALKWLPQRPREAIQVLALQFLAGILAAAPVFILQL